MRICYPNHTCTLKRAGNYSTAIGITQHNNRIIAVIKQILLEQFLLTVEGTASWLYWPTYALLGLQQAPAKLQVFNPAPRPTTAQSVPACLGTRCLLCGGCCWCPRTKWKRHSSMTLLHKTVQDCTTKAVQHALATLRLLFKHGLQF